MTLPDSYRNDRVGDGTTTTFPYTFKIWSAEEMRVVMTDPITGAVTEPTSGFSVTGVGSDGGNVVFDTAPADDTAIVFLPTTTYEQSTDLVNETQFFQERIEDGLDKVCRQTQLLKEESGRGLRLPDSEAGADALTVLPPLAERKGYGLGFDATTGNPIAGTFSTITSVAMTPVVSSETLDAAADAFTFSASGGSSSRSMRDRFADSYHAKDFGAVGDGVVDDAAAITAAMAAVSARGGGKLRFGPSTYRLLSRLDVPSGVRLEGEPGATKFDFRDKSGYENGVTSGLIRAQGSLGTPVALTQSLKRTPSIAPRISSATRSGTTVTANTDIAHGLSTGDPVWVVGSPSVAQSVFFTVKQSAGATARTTPAVVASTPSGTQFTYTVADTGDTVLSALAYLYRASDVVVVADTSGFAAGQTIMVRSEYVRSDGAGETNRIGEFQVVARILSSTMLMLHGEVHDEYLTSDTAQIVPVTFQAGFGMRGIEVIGKGANTGSGYGDRGVMAYLCLSPMIEQCAFTNCDQMGTNIWSCFGGAVRNCRFQSDASDESGQSSGALDIQYGVGFGGCTTGLEIAGNIVTGGRHAIVQTMTSTAGYHGVARNITIQGNTCVGQWLAAICSHLGIDNVSIIGNTVSGAEGGVNIRFGRNVTIAANVLVAFEYGVYCFNVLENTSITDNVIRGPQYGVRVDTLLSGGFVGPIKINDNNITGGEYGVYVFRSTTGLLVEGIDITGNTIKDTKYEGIRVWVGDSAASGDGWWGAVDNNRLLNVGLVGSRQGMWLTNFKGGGANGNTFRGSVALSRGFYVDGAGTADGLHFFDNHFQAGLISVQPVGPTVGVWHRTNAPATLTPVVIASGAVSPPLAQGLIVVDTESAAAADDLDTIAAGFVGQTITLRCASAARVVTVRDNIGNIQTAGSVSRVLDATRDTLTLIYDGSSWNEIAFSAA